MRSFGPQDWLSQLASVYARIPKKYNSNASEEMDLQWARDQAGKESKPAPSSMSLYRLPAGVAQIKAWFSHLKKIWIKAIPSYFKDSD